MKRRNSEMFGREAVAQAKRVTRVRRVRDKESGQLGEIIGKAAQGFVKVKWQDRAKPTLIKRSEIALVRGNPHRSYHRLSTDRVRAETGVLKKANLEYARAVKLEAQGKPLQARAAAERARNLMKRARQGGRYSEGPVGILPNPVYFATDVAERDAYLARLKTKGYGSKRNPKHGSRDALGVWHAENPSGLTKQHWRGSSGNELAIYDIVNAAGKKVATFYGGKVGVNMAAKRYENDKDLIAAIERLIGAKVRLFKYQHKGGASKAIARRNPSTKEMSERFTGAASGKVAELKASDRAPANLARAGKLIFLKLADKKVQLRIPGAIVCIDPKTEKLWIAGNRAPLLTPKAKAGEVLDFGDVEKICYETAKAHIENGRVTEYVHSFGGNGGRKPRLQVDKDGMPILSGGEYKIRAEGIVN